MRARLATVATAVVASFGIAYLVGDNVDPIVEDEPAHEEPSGGFGHEHTEHTP